MSTTLAARNLNHGQLTIKDGTGTPKTLAIPIEVGDLSFKVTQTVNQIRDRNALVGFAKGLDQPIDLSFTIRFEEWTADPAQTAPSPADALMGTGVAAAQSWVSTSTSGPWTSDLVFDIASPDTSKAEKLTFSKFAVETLDFSEAAESNTLKVSGKARLTTPVAQRI